LADLNEALWAISSLDGRYRAKLRDLSMHVSEAALIRYRIRVEAGWLLHLADAPDLKGTFTLSPAARKDLVDLTTEELANDVLLAVKEIEAVTNHDVKAVEYYLRDRLKALGADDKVLSFTA